MPGQRQGRVVRLSVEVKEGRRAQNSPGASSLVLMPFPGRGSLLKAHFLLGRKGRSSQGLNNLPMHFLLLHVPTWNFHGMRQPAPLRQTNSIRCDLYTPYSSLLTFRLSSFLLPKASLWRGGWAGWKGEWGSSDLRPGGSVSVKNMRRRTLALPSLCPLPCPLLLNEGVHASQMPLPPQPSLPPSPKNPRWGGWDGWMDGLGGRGDGTLGSAHLPPASMAWALHTFAFGLALALQPLSFSPLC